MNAILQAQLDRIETALNTLVDSITSYNPSISAIHELLSADDSLTEGLDQCTPHPFPSFFSHPMLSFWTVAPSHLSCSLTHPLILPTVSTHQTNHAKILALQANTTFLDDHLASTLRTLAQTRSDILSARATAFSPSQRSVMHTELLDYATNISRYTAPPGLREKLATLQQKPEEIVVENGSEQPATQAESTQPSTQQATQQATQQSNGINSAASSFPTPFHPTSPRLDPTTMTPTSSAARNIGMSTLTIQEKHWLEPLMQMAFLPWPSEEVIRRGALSSLSGRIESGEDLLEGHEAGSAMEGVEQAQAIGMEGSNVERQNGVVRAEGGATRQMEEKPKRKPSVFDKLDLYVPEDE